MATGNSSPPRCPCHDEVMLWNKDARKTQGGIWKCAERNRAHQRKYYARESGLAYNRRLLRHRRNKALTRRREREAA